MRKKLEMTKMSLKSILVLLVIVTSSGCEENNPSAQEVLNKAITIHGFDKSNDLDVSFEFRNKFFEADLSSMSNVLKRVTRDANRTVEDIIDDDSFIHKIDNQIVPLDSESLGRNLNDTRSVIYFALLPYGVNQGAISKELMPSIKIKGEPYYKVEVTYGKNGGGGDFENVFVYWIHKKNYTVDYLAYSYYINGGGVRFREAYNQREVNGIRFQDYVNYTLDKDFPAHELDYAFQTGQLKEISRIELENVSVVKETLFSQIK
jgi:hypothetical protein